MGVLLAFHPKVPAIPVLFILAPFITTEEWVD
jgi:hypothetical protein